MLLFCFVQCFLALLCGNNLYSVWLCKVRKRDRSKKNIIQCFALLQLASKLKLLSKWVNFYFVFTILLLIVQNFREGTDAAVVQWGFLPTKCAFNARKFSKSQHSVCHESAMESSCSSTSCHGAAFGASNTNPASALSTAGLSTTDISTASTTK